VIEPTDEMVAAFRTAYADAIIAGEPPNGSGRLVAAAAIPTTA
jgi:hypothetical protein